ncbi:MAG: hypothetical protein AVDCRST_MAG04-3238, partial [uncultured Acetobacteraceae bacterium]
VSHRSRLRGTARRQRADRLVGTRCVLDARRAAVARPSRRSVAGHARRHLRRGAGAGALAGPARGLGRRPGRERRDAPRRPRRRPVPHHRRVRAGRSGPARLRRPLR